MQTMLEVADNTGARRVMCIKVLGGSKRRYAAHRRRDQGQHQGCGAARPREKGRDLPRGGRAHAAGRAPRLTARKVKFDTNAAVLLTPKLEPIGTRILGPVTASCAPSGS